MLTARSCSEQTGKSGGGAGRGFDVGGDWGSGVIEAGSGRVYRTTTVPLFAGIEIGQVDAFTDTSDNQTLH